MSEKEQEAGELEGEKTHTKRQEKEQKGESDMISAPEEPPAHCCPLGKSFHAPTITRQLRAPRALVVKTQQQQNSVAVQLQLTICPHLIVFLSP